MADIRVKLESRGWKPLERDWLNPTLPSSHVRGWTYFIDGTATPHLGIHQWLANWENGSGDIVGYALRYSSNSPDERRDMAAPSGDDLQVIAMLIPAETAKAMQATALQNAKTRKP